MHVDAFIDSFKTDAYASWVFCHFRLPAVVKLKVDEFMESHRLFATYEGKRYRVTGCSRFGDVWLATDFGRDCGYDLRVDVEKLSDFGALP